jgi:hypothetical protein
MPDPALSKLYLVLGASRLDEDVRDELFQLWTGESRLLTAAITAIQDGVAFDLSRL